MRTRRGNPGPIVRSQPVSAVKAQRAKELRAQQTYEEALLWQRVRRNSLGYHFRRQQVIAGFIVDFYCHQAKLVIEIDGPLHDIQQEEDRARDQVLTNMGLRLLRVPAVEVRENLVGVLRAISDACTRS